MQGRKKRKDKNEYLRDTQSPEGYQPQNLMMKKDERRLQMENQETKQEIEDQKKSRGQEVGRKSRNPARRDEGNNSNIGRNIDKVQRTKTIPRTHTLRREERQTI